MVFHSTRKDGRGHRERIYSEPMVTVGLRLPQRLARRWSKLSVDVRRGLIVSALEGLSGRVRAKRVSDLDRGHRKIL